MKVILILLLTFNVLASSGPKANEITFATNVSSYLKDLVIELYVNSQINQEYIAELGESLTAPLDNDFIELTILNSVLNTKTTKKYQHIDISQSLYNDLDKKIKELDSDLTFSIMISKKILRDIGELLTNDTLKEYNAWIANKETEPSVKLKEFISRLSYLQFWIDTLKSPSEIRKKTFLSTNLEILNTVKRNLTISARTGEEGKKISYISINDVDLIKARRAVDKLFFESTPDKDPDYKAPENLPEAVDGW